MTGTTAYTLGAIEGDNYRWMKLPMPGETLAGPVEVTPDERARLTVPEDIQKAMAGVVTPGTTVVVTPDTLQKRRRGQEDDGDHLGRIERRRTLNLIRSF